MWLPLLALAGGAFGALILSDRAPGDPEAGGPSPSPVIKDRVRVLGLSPGSSEGWASNLLAIVAGSESAGAGGTAALNRNWDGCGLSVGLIQWAQCVGNLGLLLDAQYAADRGLFERLYGGRECAVKLLEVTNAKSRSGRLAPVCGAVLWEEPWVQRFQEANSHPTFQRVQEQLALEGTHFQGAVKAAKNLTGGVASERMMALFYDRAVQQGPNHVARHAQKLREAMLGEGSSAADHRQLMERFARGVHAHFRRTTPPKSMNYNAHLEWRPVGDEWHVFTKPTARHGGVDLWVKINQRNRKILDHPELRDALIRV